MNNKIGGALAWQQVGKELDPERHDEAEAKRQAEFARLEVSLELDRLLLKLEYLRSKKYERIKGYLINGIKSNRLESQDPEQMLKNILEFHADVQKLYLPLPWIYEPLAFDVASDKDIFHTQPVDYRRKSAASGLNQRKRK